MQTVAVPNSFRTQSGERAYQDAKERGLTVPLQQEEVLIAWKNWKLIANRFPYDLIYSTHDMLIPCRTFPSMRDMTLTEHQELQDILDELKNQYDLVFINLPRKTSIKDLFHIHLAVNKPREAVAA